MLDKKKIKLMTRISIYEKNEDTNDLALSKFYKEDYAKYGCLKTLVATTVCYWLCIAVYILMNFEQVLNNLNTMDYFKTISRLMGGYIITMIVFYIYAFVVYNIKYIKAKKGIISYNRDLSRLIKLYEKQEAHDRVIKGKVKVYSDIGGDMDDYEETSVIDETLNKTGNNIQSEVNEFRDLDGYYSDSGLRYVDDDTTDMNDVEEPAQ
ncbi:MAG TPA: hypothetical protein DEO83_07970 [Lachnospiraceae bacterium]|nr:hypothetical protein [Lachnospiraceae bacterium]